MSGLSKNQITKIFAVVFLLLGFFFIDYAPYVSTASYVIYPNGGETLELGKAMTIRWRSGDP